MNIDLNNETDKQILETFSQETINSITKENVDYFGINLSSDLNTDIAYKIYWLNKPSELIYSQHEKNPIVEYLYKKNMVANLFVIHDKNYNGFSKYDIALKNRFNNNMLEMFSFFEDNLPIFKQNKDQIINLAKMKLKPDEDRSYSAFHFMGLAYENEENSIFKAYWANIINTKKIYYDNDYYFDYLSQNSGVPQFKDLIPMIKEILSYCGGYLLLEGIDYNLSGSNSYKIYVALAKNLYSGLVKTLPQSYETLKKQILKIQNWHEFHPELNCAGFALGTDNQNNLNIKLYYNFS